MAHRDASILVSLIGYVWLWMLGIGSFPAYFKVLRVSMDLKHTVTIIQGVPAVLSLVTVPVIAWLAPNVSGAA